MLQACPPIHGDGTELHFHTHMPLFIVQIDRDSYNQVQTPVTIALGILDIVFSFDEFHIVLAEK